MRDRGKAVAAHNKNSSSSNNNFYSTTSSTSSSDLVLCRKHPSSSSVGICAYCLKDRLTKLVCSDCGEQRLSSCSCSSEISSHRNSSSCTLDVGSVARVSFLIENDNKSTAPEFSLLLTPNRRSGKLPPPKSECKSSVDDVSADDDEIFLRRSSSSSIDVKQRSNNTVGGGAAGGFWGIKKLFGRKKKDDKGGFGIGGDGKNEMWVVENGVVSRSRSLCIFRGDESGGGELNSNSNSNVVSGGGGDGGRSSCGVNINITDQPRKSSDLVKPEAGFDLEGANGRVFSLRESDKSKISDSGFIDLTFGFPAPKDFASARSNSYCGFADRGNGGSGGGGRGSFGSVVAASGEGGFGSTVGVGGGSCRITVNDRGVGVRKSRKSTKVWRWIFRGNHHRNEEGRRSLH